MDSLSLNLGRDASTEELMKILGDISKTLAYFDMKIATADTAHERDALGQAKLRYDNTFIRYQRYIVDHALNVSSMCTAVCIKNGELVHLDQNMRQVDPEDKKQCQEMYSAWEHCHRKAIEELIGKELADERDQIAIQVEELVP